MSRFVIKALPSEEDLEYLQPEDLENETTVVELDEGEKRFILATIPERTTDAEAAELLEMLQEVAPDRAVVIVTEGITVEVVEIKQVESAWERL